MPFFPVFFFLRCSPHYPVLRTRGHFISTNSPTFPPKIQLHPESRPWPHSYPNLNRIFGPLYDRDFFHFTAICTPTPTIHVYPCIYVEIRDDNQWLPPSTSPTCILRPFLLTQHFTDLNTRCLDKTHFNVIPSSTSPLASTTDTLSLSVSTSFSLQLNTASISCISSTYYFSFRSPLFSRASLRQLIFSHHHSAQARRSS